jgi:hypothetical protein
MTTLTLTKLFVNLVSSGAAVSAQSTGRGEDYTNTGEVKQLAGERLRAVTVAGERGQFAFVMLEVPAADVATLRLWKGQLVLVRDDRGRAFYGVYHNVRPTDVPDKKTSYNVAITLFVVTADTGV